jgi:hypothetical protein
LSFDTCCELGICNPRNFVFTLKSEDALADSADEIRSFKKRTKTIKREKQSIVLTEEQEEYKANIMKDFPKVFSGKVGC